MLLHVGGNAHIQGDLTISGTFERIAATTLAVEDKYIISNVGGDAADSPNGGMLVELGTPVAQHSVGSGTDGTHAGIRFTEGTGWQISVGTTATGGA